MRPRISLRRPTLRTVAPFVAGLLVGIPAVALAGHQFPDVSDEHPFHADIAAIAEAGITAGFSDDTYRPGDPVTRQAMAAFMHRGFGRAALAAGATTMTASVALAAGARNTPNVPVRQLTIDVPGASNAFGPQQLVHLQGRIHFFTSMYSATKGCPCEFSAVIRDATLLPSVPAVQTFETSVDDVLLYSFDVEGLFAAPPGPHTYRLDVRLSYRSFVTNAASFHLHANSSLSATTFPFGPAGTDSLSSAGAENVTPDVDQLPERRDE